MRRVGFCPALERGGVLDPCDQCARLCRHHARDDEAVGLWVYSCDRRLLQRADGARRHTRRGPRNHAGRRGGIRDDHRRRPVLDQTRVILRRQNLLTPSPQDPRTSAVVTFANVRIGFDEEDVLRGVSFEVMPRETLVLLGETGTGKTLTLKLAAGLLRPTQGKIEVLGQEVSAVSEQEVRLYRRQFGIVVQEGARFDPESKRVVRPTESSIPAGGGNGEPATRFVLYREGRVYFEGKPEELAESKDAYLQRFLV